MSHAKGLVGNVIAWLGALAPIAAQLDPVLQLVAILCAIGASIATWRYYAKKRKAL